MTEQDRNELWSEWISQRAASPDMSPPPGVTAEEWEEIGRLASIETALWNRAHTAPPIEQDRVAAMLGLVPDPHFALDTTGLTRARKRAGWSIGDLAARLSERGWDTSQAEILRWQIQGAQEVPPALIEAMAKLLSVGVADISSERAAVGHESLDQATGSARFSDLADRFARLLGVSVTAARTRLRATALATVHRGDQPSPEQWLDTLERYVSAMEDRRGP